ncbi:MAG TPA: hypothetical protein VH853_00895 [Polyangia bacterium]|nr:hypothetical protein [Polyangia bacterium]
MNSFQSLLATFFVVAGVASASRAAPADEPSPGGAADPSVQVEPSSGQPPPARPESPAANISAAPPLQPLAPAPSVVPPSTPELGGRIVPTPPPGEARFGDAGQFVFDSALSAELGHLGFSAGGSTTSLTIQPAFDYFGAPNLSVGVSALLRYIDNEPPTSGGYVVLGTKDLTLGLSGAVGFNVWLGNRVSFWPRLSLGVSWTREKLSSVGPTPSNGAPFEIVSPTETQTVVVVELLAPFLLHLTQHFFVGFGPDLYIDLHNTFDGASNKRTFIGAASTVGGWF